MVSGRFSWTMQLAKWMFANLMIKLYGAIIMFSRKVSMLSSRPIKYGIPYHVDLALSPDKYSKKKLLCLAISFQLINLNFLFLNGFF